MDGWMDGWMDLINQYNLFIFSGVPEFQNFSCCSSSCISSCINVSVGEIVTFDVSIQYQSGGAADDNLSVKTLTLQNEDIILVNCGTGVCESQKEEKVNHRNFSNLDVYNVTFEITNARINDTGIYSIIASAFTSSVTYSVTRIVTINVTNEIPGVSIIMSVQCACLCR